MGKSELLVALDEKVQQCKKCQELVANRSRTVFGVGNPDTKIVFCGEASGLDRKRHLFILQPNDAP